jgi:hypothetical protein
MSSSSIDITTGQLSPPAHKLLRRISGDLYEETHHPRSGGCYCRNSTGANAQIVQFVGVGTTAAYNSFALAAVKDIGATNLWTAKGKAADGANFAQAQDQRSSSIPPQGGTIWIAWDNNPSPDVYVYLSVDSTIGVQALLANPGAVLQIDSSAETTAGQNLVPYTGVPDASSVPASIYSAINNKLFNAALSALRPEDALAATTRALKALSTTNYSGLGYTGTGEIGTPIVSAFSTSSNTPVNFALKGKDPISGLTVNPWISTNIGAVPVLILVNNLDTALGGLGSLNSSSSPVFTNVNVQDLANIFQATSTRTRDLLPAAGLPPIGLHVIQRDPLTGVFNTVEFDAVRNSANLTKSQEEGVNPATENPLNISVTHADGSTATRQRTIGTSEEVKELEAIDDAIGYAFFTFGDFASAGTKLRYLTVNGVDPLFATYSGGTLPLCTSSGCAGSVTFPHVSDGTYPLWALLEVITGKTVPPGVTAIVNAAATEVVNVPEWVPVSQLQVFRDHYTQSGAAGSNGYRTGHPEAGGSAGGAIITIQSDLDSITDFGVEILNQKQ